ncbi:iron complex transport system permease protein [Limimonas halophila]|uniref:Iron complex transport system permease protein n=1 Tax=Limimonas halophila TaxID=1082479 RepID=A0A1G7M3L3_9PROT|nr:iron ABC transporter permease [Limimonas halophila]SDF56234.1 iron complex transport system permease protein [Limimonas halophila]
MADRARILLPLLAVGTMLALAGSLLIGPAGLMPRAVLGALVDADAGTAAVVVREIRLPRTLLAAAIGATLGLSGAALQGYLRNPLAEPGLIGVSGAAALGAVLTLYTGAAAAFALALPLGGIAGAIAAVLLVLLLAGRHADTLTLILAGVAVTSLAAALTSLALNLAPSPYAALEIVFWLLGSLSGRSMEHVALALPFMAVGWALLASVGRALDALALGEEAAQSLGFHLAGVRVRLVLGTALSVGAATAVAGTIGFVGLVVPHALRPLVGHRPRALLPVSALGGALLLVLADILVRAVTPTNELKLGVVTALIGAPFFFALVIRTRRGLA